jgi:hypothetical protein
LASTGTGVSSPCRIENARLLKQLRESLQQQTALGQILDLAGNEAVHGEIDHAVVRARGALHRRLTRGLP